MIYRGRDLLWFSPTEEAPGQYRREELDSLSVGMVEEDRRFDTLDDAAQFVQSLTPAERATTTASRRLKILNSSKRLISTRCGKGIVIHSQNTLISQCVNHEVLQRNLKRPVNRPKLHEKCMTGAIKSALARVTTDPRTPTETATK